MLQLLLAIIIAQKPSLDDGPHLCWQNDTTATVFYYFEEELVSRTFSDPDTIRFQGFCGEDTAFYSIPVSPPSIESFDIEQQPRIMAISDIHGDYQHFREILHNAEIIDSSGNWSWDTGHLVITGDVFDRGPAVTEILWLIYQLEQQALSAGGAVHFMLGNHELMVLLGDLRYVHNKYMNGIAGSTRIEYDELFAPNMELGRWLRSKPTALKIGNILFVHAGIAPATLAPLQTLTEINELARSGFDLTSVEFRFHDDIRSLYGSLGPYWYRGYHYAMEDDYPLAGENEINDILNFYNVEHIVVGHTEHDSLTALYNSSVIAIDVAVEELQGQQALLIENDRFYRLDADGSLRELDTIPGSSDFPY